MKKKIITAIVIVAVLTAAVIFITGFSGESEPETTAPIEGQPVTVNIEPETTEGKKEKTTSYNKKVTVTLPADVVDEKYNGDLDAFAEAEGYDWAKLTKDGQVKIKMRAFSYSLILANIGMDTISTIGYAMDSGEFPYFIDLAKYSDNFDYVVITVDKDEYEKAENSELLLAQIALACLYYQSYDVDSEDKCEIVVCEEGTNILIESQVFTMEDLNNF